MKIINFFLLIGIMLIHYSCSEMTPDLGLSAGQSKVTADLSGDISGNFSSDKLTSTTVETNGVVVIAAIRVVSPVKTRLFNINIWGNLAPGTYKIHDVTNERLSGTFAYVENSMDPNSLYAAGAEEDNNFTYTIAVNDGKTLEGTFNGDMFNPQGKKITVNGTFKAAYK